MLGSTLFHYFRRSPSIEVYGLVRDHKLRPLFSDFDRQYLVFGHDFRNDDQLGSVLETMYPDVIINCVANLRPQITQSDVLNGFEINSILPHRIAWHCSRRGCRLIHISTDGVFSGETGSYTESDVPDPIDRYGQQKLLGEVAYARALTIRTSIIGHDLFPGNNLIDWLLRQRGTCKGFSRVIFNGLPTLELARVLRDYVLPVPSLRGIFHVGASPISKFSLIKLVAEVYDLNLQIEAEDSICCNRSLDCKEFQTRTGYVAPDWPSLIISMHDCYQRTLNHVQE